MYECRIPAIRKRRGHWGANKNKIHVCFVCDLHCDTAAQPYICYMLRYSFVFICCKYCAKSYGAEDKFKIYQANCSRYKFFLFMKRIAVTWSNQTMNNQTRQMKKKKKQQELQHFVIRFSDLGLRPIDPRNVNLECLLLSFNYIYKLLLQFRAVGRRYHSCRPIELHVRSPFTQIAVSVLCVVCVRGREIQFNLNFNWYRYNCSICRFYQIMPTFRLQWITNMDNGYHGSISETIWMALN